MMINKTSMSNFLLSFSSHKELQNRLMFFMICIQCLLFSYIPIDAYRVYGSSNETEPFKPYEKGFVGKVGDPSIPQTPRINPGIELVKEYKENSKRLQNCPGMVGPIDDKYYCLGKEYGFCDRRSGACFCNHGYQGISCQQCLPSHIRVGELCYPRKSCPNDCSNYKTTLGGSIRRGVCNYITGECNCLDHWTGHDCSMRTCHLYHQYCVQCNDQQCLECVQGYSVHLPSNICQPCARFDPRCHFCNEKECLACIDLLLLSIRRAGPRPQDLQILPIDEQERELSITVPFGSLQTNAFDEAEHYFLVDDSDGTSLKDKALTCHQGYHMDDTFVCSNNVTISHQVCGNYGVVSFTSPTYAMDENARHIRITIQRTGGGVGQIHVSYEIFHITTDHSDVTPTAFYTANQQIVFHQGEVQKSFLITIHDDRTMEQNETFQIDLTEPSTNTSLGPQKRAIITIIDDDADKTCSSESFISMNTYLSPEKMYSIAGETFYFQLQAVSCSGHHRRSGGDIFTILMVPKELQNDGKTIVPITPFRGIVMDNGDGTYNCSIQIPIAGVYNFNIYQLIPGGLLGSYYDDSYFSSLEKIRVDSVLNFTWSFERITSFGIDFVSIRWEGFLKSSFSEMYRFIGQFDDRVRIWLDHTLIIDTWNRNDILTSSFYFLNSNLFYAIVIEYIELEGNAMAKLIWESDNTPLEIIPSSAYYYREHIDESPFVFHVFAAEANAMTSRPMGLNLVHGVAQEQNKFSIVSRDVFGNVRGDVGSKWKDIFTSFQDRDGFHAIAELVENDQGKRHKIDFHVSIIYCYETKLYNATYIPFTSGRYNLNITLSSEILGSNIAGSEHIFGSPFQLTIAPGRNTFAKESVVFGDDGLCSLTYHPFNETCSSINYGVAGVEQSFFIESMDSNKNRRGVGGDNWVVTIQSSKSPEIQQYGRIQDNHDGRYTVFVVPVSSGLNQLSIRLDGIHLKGSPFDLYVKHNIAHGPSCLIVTDLSETTIVATNVNTLLVQTVDEYSNHLESNEPPHVYNVTVSIEHLSSTNTRVEGDYLLLESGKISISFTPILSGVSFLNILINNEHIKGSPFKIDVTAGNVGKSSSTATGSGLSHAVAGETAEFIVQARDANGNPTTKIDHYFIACLQLSEVSNRPNGADMSWGNQTKYDVKSISIGDGKHFIQYNATVSGTYTIQVMKPEKFGGHEILGSPFSVFVSPSHVFFENIEVTGQGSRKGVAGETALIKIYSRDLFGNYLISGGDKYMVQLLLKSRHEQEWENSEFDVQDRNDDAKKTNLKRVEKVIDNNNGQYFAYYLPYFSGQYTLKVTLENKGGLHGSYFDVLDFDSSRLIFERIDRAIDKSWSSNRVYKCNINSASDNVNSSPESCEREDLLLPQISFGIEWKGKIKADFSEEYTIRVECDSESEVQVIVKENIVIEWDSCFRKLEGSVIFEAFEMVDIRIRFRHKIDDAFIKVKWSCLSQREFTTIPAKNLYHDILLDGLSDPVVIHPNTINPQSSTALGDATRIAVAGKSHSFIVEARDKFGNGIWGNLQLNGGATVNAYARGGATREENRIDSYIEDNKNGTYTVKYTPIFSGSYLLSISIGDGKVHSDLGYYMEDLSIASSHINGSPFNLKVTPGATYPQSCHIYGTNQIKAKAGMKNTLEIHAKDFHGNHRGIGGDNFTAFITKESNSSSDKIAIANIIDKYNGKYQVQFLVTNPTGEFFLHVIMWSLIDETSHEIMGSPYNVTVTPSEVYVSNTYVTSGAIFSQDENDKVYWYFRSQVGYKKDFDVTTVDAYGNHLRSGGINFVGRIRGETHISDKEKRLKISDNDDGSYTCLYHISTIGKYEIDIAMADNQNGLLGSYYSNPYFGGEPYLSRVDSFIDFNWGYGSILPYSSDFASIRWTGFIKPAHTEPHEFELVSLNNDQIKLWVEDILIIDTNDDTKKGTCNFIGDMLHAIKLEFVEEKESASIILLWSSRRTPKHRVPSSRLFPSAEPILGSPFELEIVQ